MAKRKRFENLTDANVSELPIEAKKYDCWDTKLPGLCVRVQPTGDKTFYFVYSRSGRPRWYRIGPAVMGASEAKKEVKGLIGDVARGGDPQAERAANRKGLTFEELHARYVSEHAKVQNKSWKQADYLVRRYVLPKWAKLKA